MTIIVIFAMTGLVAGFLAGLLGIGGGLIMVPILYYVFSAQPDTAPHAMHLALASSLAFIVLNSGAAAWMHHRLGGVRWREVLLIAPGLAFGGLAGAALAGQLGSDILRGWFASFLIVMALYLLLHRARVEAKRIPEMFSAIIGLPIGMVAALAGVGGGVMVVPWMIFRGHATAIAIAISSICTVLVALLGAIGYMWFANAPEFAHATGYVYWPAVFATAITSMLVAPYGAKVAHRVDQQSLKKGFAILILLVGVKLLFG